MSRILLTLPTTFYVATTGSDTTGDGSQASPWATPKGAYSKLQAGYDLGGQQVTVSIAAGTYAVMNDCQGAIVGQKGHVLFQGAGQSTLIQPSSGYCFSASGGASIQLSQMWLDGSLGQNDTLAIGNGSQLDIWTGIVFGNNIDQWNDISVNGYLTVSADYVISKSIVQTTGTWTAGSNTITLANATGIKKYLGVAGNNIPAGAFVTSISGNVIGLDYVKGAPVRATTGSETNRALTFSYGGQCHIDAGNGGRVFYMTNNDPAHAINVAVYGNPMYLAGFMYLSGLSMANASAINFTPQYNGANCVPFDISENSILYSGGQNRHYYPGYVANADGSYGLIATGAQYV